MKLLIADDEYFIRQGLATLDWASLGIDEVLTAEDGLSAKQILSVQNIDIVITDIKMPGLSGLEISDYIKHNNLNTKVIILSGFSDFEYARHAITANVFSYLLKPINLDELMDVTRKAIEEIEYERQKEEIISRYEIVKGSMNNTERIINSFYYCSKSVIEILKFIAENYNCQISLNSLSAKYHFNPVYLSHLIKKETGYSFSDILLSIRLINAAKLIWHTKEKIGIICEQVGFKDQRYFSQVFKKVFNMTPHEYRRIKQEPKEYSIVQMIETLNSNKLMKEE
ncbi:response regulator [Mahella sp.]|uniref:response regulator transcription factor n=1 Tax=Mahella sp. TaxID=2798721 RepID=UPI0025BF1801|nr:response regulator [Mahella sp.]MBZ4665140.1 hypothetical protein [Mahella sp.]